MVKTIRKQLTLLLLMIFVVSMVACSSGSNDANSEPLSSNQQSSTNTTQKNEEKVELTFWNSWANGENPLTKYNKSLVEDFMQQNPNIKITQDNIPHDQYKIKIKTQAAGKELPDMWISWPAAEMEPVAKAGLIMPLDNLLEEKSSYISKESIADYNIVGKQYGIPWELQSCSMVYYDPDILRKYGFEKFPDNYDDFVTLIKSLRSNGINPIALGNKSKWPLECGYQSLIVDRFTGKNFIPQLLKGERKFTDPDYVKGLQIIKDLVDMKAFNEDFNIIDNNQQQDYFAQGKSAMFIEGSWAIESVRPKMPKDKKIAVANFPIFKNGDKRSESSLPILTNQAVVINSALTGAEKEAALKFVDFVTSKEVYEKYVGLQRLVPAKVDLPDNIDPEFKNLIYIIQNASAHTPVYDTTLPASILTPNEDILQEMTVTNMTAEEAAKKMQVSVDEYLINNK